MGQGYGDRLARGAASATFSNAGKNVSQDRWNEIFGADSGPAQKQKAKQRKRRKSTR